MRGLEKFLTSLGHNWFDLIVIIAVAWLARHFGGIVITRIIRQTVRRSKFNDMSEIDAKKRQDTLISLLTVMWKAFVIIVAVLMIIKLLFGELIDLGPLFASAGIVGIALGFGAQSIIKDLLTGVFIISENQYRVGDVVDIEGAAGTVEKVGIRSTVLRDVDGNVHYMPNGEIMHVINKTMGFSKVNFTLAVDPDTDVDKLAKVINQVGEKMAQDEAWQEKILEPPHFVNIGNFTNLAMDVLITGKTEPSAQWSVTGELRRRLLREFHKSNIELATSLSSTPWMPQSGKKK